MTTQTTAAIVARMVLVIEGLVPAAAIPANPAGRPFRLNRRPRPSLSRWAPPAGGNDVLRLFEILGGGREDHPTNDPSATFVNVPITVTVAYPANPNLLGLKEDYELEALIESDATQIRDALYSPRGLVGSGHMASMVTPAETDRSDEQVWFKDFFCTAKFFIAQRL